MTEPGRIGAVTGDGVRTELLHRIGSGVLSVGDRLPSVRQLAKDLGSNPNTVSRQIQRLAEEGVLRSEPRRGTYVAKTLELPAANPPIRIELEAAIARASRLGLSLEEVQAIVERVFSRRATPRIAFTECNQTDLSQMQALIENATGVNVEPILLEDLAQADLTHSFAIVATPLFHLSETIEAIGGDSRIVELAFTPSSNCMRELASLDPRRCVVVAAPTSSGAERTAALVRTVFRGDVIAKVPDMLPGEPLFAEPVDVLVYVNALEVSPDQLQDVRQAIRIKWGLDSQSAERLRGRAVSLQ